MMSETDVKDYQFDFFDLSQDPRFANLSKTKEDFSRHMNDLRRGDTSFAEERMGPVNRVVVNTLDP